MNNPFKNIFSNLKVFDGTTVDSAVGVDIGSSAIKIVEIKRKKGKVSLQTYGMISLGSYAETDMGKITNLPAEEISKAVKEVLKQSGVVTTSAAISLPIQSSLIFSVELPPQIKEGEIAGIVPIEARKYIPVPITEVSLDWFLIPEKGASFEEANNPELVNLQQKKEVLVVAIQNDAISKYRSISQLSALSVGFFEIEVFSSIRSNFEHELSLVLLIDLGASRTKLSLVEFGILKSFHTISRGGADITESISTSLNIPFSKAEEKKKEFGLYGDPTEKDLADIIKLHIDYIFSETNNVLLGYEKKHNQTVTKVILTGGGALLKGMKEIAVNNFKSEVEIGNPFSKVGAPEFLGKVLENIGPEFAIAIGLALRKLQ
jgi:type IV pilus assembly protein PilM